ncbi:neurofilament heavy polypeptide-like [Cydia pomonella]|uniref:neurofilament heavy polypeptide-like n=1 Tax=Cydia pomonella TaxID=82600 RepID=UPI002ADD8F98|nr:neurofilament heavy polypeptide-like [Cydia pomonella]
MATQNNKNQNQNGPSQGHTENGPSQDHTIEDGMMGATSAVPRLLAAFWAEESQKRKRTELSEPSDEEPEAKKSAEKPKSKGSPITTGKYAGLGKTREAYKLAKEEFRRQAAEKAEADLENMTIRMRPTAERRVAHGTEGESQLMSALNAQVLDSVAVINKVVATSGNLKGTFQRKLKEAATAITDFAEVMLERTTNEETKMLQRTVARLQAQLADLQKEQEELRKELRLARAAPSPLSPASQQSLVTPSSASQQDAEHTMMVKVGKMMNARLEALEDRLLPAKTMRPPLAADKAKKTAQPPSQVNNRQAAATSRTAPTVQPVAGPSGLNKSTAPNVPQQSSAPGSERKKAATKKGKKKEKTAQPAPAPREPRPLPPAPANVDETWTKVVKKGKRKKTTGPPPQKATPKKARKLRPPRSAAIVLTLKPEVEEGKTTYGDILKEARTKIDLNELQIQGVRFKRAVTGATIIEVPGAASGEKADALADKLREKLNNEVVQVSRPTKNAEVRISGLDDSVTPEDVKEAVAKVGGCHLDQIKCGEIRQDFSGLGSIWVRCPITVVKKLTESGRLLVGWVSARVQLLDQKPMRCFRCLEAGHVRAQCRAQEDRSDLCYRCGQPGHKAATCSATPHCAVCAAANKPAGHMIGSKTCVASKIIKKGKKNGDGFRAPSQSVHQPATDAAEAEQAALMETT